MPLASAVAIELRKLADSLDAAPEAVVPTPWVSFGRDYTPQDKERFLNFARLMPKPFTKEWTDRDLTLKFKTSAITVVARIDRADVCELVEAARPAVYRCDPILSADEEEEVGNGSDND